MLIITHNLGVVARYADRVNVMYAGRIIERGTARELYANPRHPYTLGLLRSVPRLDEPRRARLAPIEGQPPDLTRLPRGCAFSPRCAFRVERCAVGGAAAARRSARPATSSACWEAERLVMEQSRDASAREPTPARSATSCSRSRDLVKHFHGRGRAVRRRAGLVRAVDGVSFTIRRGETLGLVGESGCGKTTTGRCILQLERPTSGRIVFEGRDLTTLDADASCARCAGSMQVIFQDPYAR